MRNCRPRNQNRLRRTTGWVLSAFVLLLYFSPQANLLRTLPSTLNIAAGQNAVIDTTFPLSVTLNEGNVQVLSSSDEALTGGQTQTKGKSTATINLLGLLPLREVEIDVSDDLRLYPGGQAVGVALQTAGVLVVGTSDLTGAISPARLAGIKPGDIITAANGMTIEGTTQLTELVASTGDTPLPLTVKRGEATLSLTLEPKRDNQTGTYRIGAWVRDSTAGVGTMSFYGEVNAGEGIRYGALGHAITDTDTQQILTVGKGEVMLADVVDVRKGQVGIPGELKGSFLRENRVLGGIRLNNNFGIYGTLQSPPTHPLYPDGLPIGRKDAVHAGDATILCTVDSGGMEEYDVEIVEVARQTSPSQRSMVIRVTDEELLEKTGGIVQGMSGSPILQDGRLIGAVTHVFVNDPTMGYGLFVEWMLAQ
ncbi:MAG: SpoIVB peptidase [Clostridiales bacterium]|nr:SpoIVB peptidase [Clostridiales bacterium]